MSRPMNIRATSNPLVRAAGHWLERVNDRHPWSHIDHVHPWTLRSLPAAPTRVLDVGCGRGELVGALIPRAGLVEGIDPDAAMAYATATRFWSEPRVHIARRTLTEQAGDPARAGQYDAVRSEEHTSELQSRFDVVCRLLLANKNAMRS